MVAELPRPPLCDPGQLEPKDMVSHWSPAWAPGICAAAGAATVAAACSACISLSDSRRDDQGMRQRRAGMRLFGHRGASAVCPENTRAAFEYAFRHGAAGVECDLQRLADGTIVVLLSCACTRVGGG